ncbi:MAG: hypothetical protein HPY76_11840 [Anaerolineae bacterium]|nr:hypothetical protein [Anaerolineae bacterium]
MGKIALRAYIHEIEAMVDQNQIDQAVAHCRYLLKLYPKNVDTYRVLGKAFLEARRYGESNDVFQRVLSAIPDDFVSHIGMSIIREDEGNLDAAIWHMERAFEVQPPNSIVQEELKRLFGRRDGMQPPKIRLTNGALVRMYYRGELYQQALAELRSALAEDDQRIDLELIQAKILYKQGQSVEAVEICNNILRKLPFCLEANRIIATHLQEESNNEEASLYLQRVIDLDPYAAFIEDGQSSSSDVVDDAVMVEKLELITTADEGERPAWAETAGVELSSEEIALPDWMEPPTIATQSAGIETHNDEFPEGETALPDHPSPEEETQAEIQPEVSVLPVSENAEVNGTKDEELVIPGDIPEWLRSLEPEADPGEIGNSEQPEEELQNLDEMLTSATQSPDEPAENDLPTLNTPFSELSSALNEDASIENDQGDLAEEIPSVADELPDWLRELPGIDELESAGKAATPDWLQVEEGESKLNIEGNGSLAELQFLEEDELPDLAGQTNHYTNQEETPLDATDHPTQPGAHEPEIMAKIPQASVGPQAKIDDSKMDEDTAFAWLESLAAKQGADEGTLLTPAEDLENISPQWTPEAIHEESEGELLSESGINGDETIGGGSENEMTSREEPISEIEMMTMSVDDRTEEDISQETTGENSTDQPVSELDTDDFKVDEAVQPHLESEKEAEPFLSGKDDTEIEENADKHELPDWLKNLESEYSALAPSDLMQEDGKTEMSDVVVQEDQITETEKTEPEPVITIDNPSGGLANETDQNDQTGEQPSEETLEAADKLSIARSALEDNNILLGLETYREMINEKQGLDTVIADIMNALDRHPLDIDLWQTLGDAYVQNGSLQSAIDCYSKAEELLR